MYIPPKGVDWWINYIYMLTPIVFSGQNRVLVIVLLKSFYYVWQNNINICRRSRVVRPPLEIRWRPSDANDRSMDAVVINYAYREICLGLWEWRIYRVCWYSYSFYCVHTTTTKTFTTVVSLLRRHYRVYIGVVKRAGTTVLRCYLCSLSYIQ